MNPRRRSLVACAIGAALVNAAYLATAMLTPVQLPDPSSRYEIPVGDPPYAGDVARLIECGATRFWLEDETTHMPGLWVVEASRANHGVVSCFRRRDGRTIAAYPGR